MDHRFEFTLKDSTGESHKYTGTYFDGVEGIQLVTDVRLLALEPLGQLAEGGLPKIAKMYKEKGKEAILSADAMDLFVEVIGSGIGWSHVAGDIRRAIMSVGGSKLIRRILTLTYRDGSRLSADRHFGDAYRRNWDEMYLAAWEVAKVNDFLGSTFTLTGSSKQGTDEVEVKAPHASLNNEEQQTVQV